MKYVVLSIGVNDIETFSVEEVLQQLKTLVHLLVRRPKIVIGELTPRNDELDERVKECNELLKQYTDENEYLFLAK